MPLLRKKQWGQIMRMRLRECWIICCEGSSRRCVQGDLTILVPLAMHGKRPTSLAEPDMRAGECANFSRTQPRMQHEDEDGLVSCASLLGDCRDQCLFFLVIEMTWRDHFLAHEFDHLSRVVGELPEGLEPGKVALEGNERTIDGSRLELQQVLEIGPVLDERWSGDFLGGKRRSMLTTLRPSCLAPGGSSAVRPVCPGAR